MNETTLYFNGITPQGEYALPPQTAHQFMEHIRSNRDRAKALEAQLAEALRSAGKVQEIVDFLLDKNLDMLAGEAITREAWLDALAKRLLVTILGEDAARTGNVRLLARKLDENPREKVAQIVAAFLDPGVGQSQNVEALLLPPSPAETFDLKGMLKHRTLVLAGAIGNDLLSEKCAAKLAVDSDYQVVWLNDLVWRLLDLPIESLKALSDSRTIVSEPLKRLVAELRALAGAESAQLAGELEPESTKGKYASWPVAVQILKSGLWRFVENPAAVDWGELLGVMVVWINKMLNIVGSMSPVPSVDPKRLETSGWGVVFPADWDQARVDEIKHALCPLLELRKKQAAKEKPLYQVYDGAKGYRPGDDARSFLERLHADASQPADPKQTGVPYYLMLVGSPVDIPFAFQYSLDVQYAVGRIDFDRVEDYAAYARSVVAAEADDFALAPEALFVPVENPGDEATELSAKHLVKPLCEQLAERVSGEVAKGTFAAWRLRAIPPETATRPKLLEIVRRDTAPALLFTASHGMQFSPEEPKQRANQGALVCAEWQGEGHAVSEDFYLSGNVLTAQDDANLLGTIAFLFACYGAGTPTTDDYYRQDFGEPGTVIADEPFVAALPKAMLSLAKGGALAVVGHVERVWSLSYLGGDAGDPRREEHLGVFKAALEHLLQGVPVGAAMEYFAMRYAALSTELTAAFDAVFGGPDDFEMAKLWTANNDARGYVILGDPAVRLKVAPTAAEAKPRKDLI